MAVPVLPARRMPTAFAGLEHLRILLVKSALRVDSTVEGLCRICLEEAMDRLHYSWSAIYLLNPSGCLEKVAAQGSAMHGPEDCGSRDGAATLEEYLAIRPGDTYARLPADSLGPGHGRLRVPLNGSSQTFGLVEAEQAQSSWQDQEIEHLAIVAMTLAGAITSLRARKEALALSLVAQRLAKAEVDPTASASLEHAAGGALQEVVDGLSDIRAAVLRIRIAGERLPVRAKAFAAGITFDGWEDVEFSHGPRLAERVFQSRRPIHVPRIEAVPREWFANIGWIERHGLRSCACYPLLARDSVVGTLTIYTGFEYRENPVRTTLLESLSDTFALFLDRARVQREAHDIRGDIARLRAEGARQRVDTARKLAMSYSEEARLHELKNVLRRVARGLDAAIENPETREEALGSLRKEVEASATRAQEHLALRAVRFDLGQQIRDVVGWYSAELAESGIEVRYVLEPVPEVEMIREGFSDALGNLLANAIRAIQTHRNSGGKIEVGCERVEFEGASCVDVSVKDNGKGVAEGERARVFEPGFTTYPDAGGTGWGLFLARQVMGRYNGRILFQSELGEGARVILRFPVRRILAAFP